jgi:probable HAF family extracellular repeat protein
MKSTLLILIGAVSLLAALAMPVQVVAQDGQQHQAEHLHRYTVTDLGTLPGGTSSQASYVNNYGLVTGVSTIPAGTAHAVLWYQGSVTDIAKQRPAGQNSEAFGVNALGLVMGQTEISTTDPNNENFCAYGTGLECRAFLWQDGVMIQLPTLGGNNASVGQINNRGELAGYAENSTRDPECAPGVAVSGTGPQVLDFEPVIWGPRPGEIRELHPLPGDTVGVAFWINDNGQAVGTSGTCGNTVLPGPSAGPHAVLWENGTVTDLGNLGGTVNTSLFGVGNVGFAINNRAQVAGISALRGNTNAHAFLWTRDTGMRDLGTLPGDAMSAGLGINNGGEVVGPSLDASGNPSAFLWRKGVMTGLNQLIPTDSQLYLLIAYGINDVGEIAGYGVDSTGDIHAFLATPCDRNHEDTGWCNDDAEGSAAEGAETNERPRQVLSENARNQLQKLLRFRMPGPQLTQPQ